MFNKKINLILGITLLNIFVSAAILLGPTNIAELSETKVQYGFTWLSISNFQKLGDETEKAIVATTRDAVVFTLHTDNQHELDECVRAFAGRDLEAIKNAMAAMPPENEQYGESGVGTVGRMLVQMCALTLDQQQTPNPQTLPNPNL